MQSHVNAVNGVDVVFLGTSGMAVVHHDTTKNHASLLIYTAAKCDMGHVQLKFPKTKDWFEMVSLTTPKHTWRINKKYNGKF